ncbi:type IV pilus assembly protein FimV [Noviherbaspirillum pedocola]|uniref:FimV N-terminal domain-containing protein n=1 Tax=Noviherbaspirillum pedocola TaxID=2801341 RepID=A0A934SXR0_9BURK|nr:hypothetical protein [Noviherbaspirillum pedocola]MBK4737463.1 hypothetical protein [Noviherbaspirillum pedocola]
MSCANAHALGLGNLVLHSHLGMALSASVEVNGVDTENQPNLCLRSRLESLDGRLLTVPQSTMVRKGDVGELRIRSREPVEEPAATLSIEIGCGATVRREFAILLDPAPAQAAMPAMLAPAVSGTQESTNASSGRSKAKPAGALASPKRSVSPIMKEKEGAASVLHLSAPTQPEPQVIIAAEPTRLKMTETLSEAQLAADPARREAMRADQKRVAALLRGEDPYQAMEFRLREAQVREKAMRQEATLSKQQSAADHQALDNAKRQRWIDALLVGLASALLALGARAAWLRWGSVRERQVQEPFSLESVGTDLHDSPAKSLRAKDISPQALETGEPAPLKADAVNPNPSVPGFPAVADSATDLLVRPSSEEPSREKPAAPLDFGFVWHESKETVMTAEPFALAADEAGNERDWLSDAAIDTPPLTLQPSESAAEIATLLLGVEIWMTDHNPLRAIGMLEPVCAQEPQLSPAPMRYLIELYRIVGNEEKLAATQTRFASHFPLARAPEHAGWQHDAAASGLVEFPEILAEIEQLRDSDDFLGYLQSLLLREQGFDFPTYRDIMQRIAEAMELQQQRDMADMSLDFQHD